MSLDSEESRKLAGMWEQAKESIGNEPELLFGLLALHLRFVSPHELAHAIEHRIRDNSVTISERLCQIGVIDEQIGKLLSALTEQQLAKHNNCVSDCVESLSSVDRAVLRGLLYATSPNLAATQSVEEISSVPPLPSQSQPKEIATGRLPEHRFRIIRPHARGGLGEVYVAFDEELGRTVAVKRIQGQFAKNPAIRSKFVKEAEVTGKLEHPCIVPVYGLGQYGNGQPFYAMRFVEGDSLSHAIDRYHKSKGEWDTGTRNIERANLLRRFIDVCEAIAFAHDRGVLHRDLKPGNIMLGSYGETLVVDWGLAKSIGKETDQEAGATRTDEFNNTDDVARTRMGQTVGTPAYMSPEQALGRLDRLGPRTDIFGLGATLYSILTGVSPATGTTKEEVKQNVINGIFPRPRKLDRTIPKPLEAICLKAMKRIPDQRYANASGLARDIEAYLAGEPVRAWAEPQSVQFKRWLKQHRVLVTVWLSGTFFASIALAVVVVVLLWQSAQLRAAKQESNRRFRAIESTSQQNFDSMATLQEKWKDASSVLSDSFNGNYYVAMDSPHGSHQAKLLAILLIDTHEAIAKDPESDLAAAMRSSALGRIAARHDLRILGRSPDDWFEVALTNSTDPVHESMIYRDWGEACTDLGETEKAEQSFNRCIALLQEHDPFALALFYREFAQSHAAGNKLRLVDSYLAKSEEIFRRFGSDKTDSEIGLNSRGRLKYRYGLAEVLLERAKTNKQLGSTEEARSLLKETVSLYRSIESDCGTNPRDSYQLAAALFELAVLSGTGDGPEPDPLLLEALAITRRSSFRLKDKFEYSDWSPDPLIQANIFLKTMSMDSKIYDQGIRVPKYYSQYPRNFEELFERSRYWNASWYPVPGTVKLSELESKLEDMLDRRGDN